MKRYLALGSALLAVGLGLAACGGDETGGADGENLKVAMVLPGPISDGAWNAAAYQGLKDVETQYGAEIAYTDSVVRADQESVIRGYAEKGFNVIFAHGDEFSDPVAAVASDFPDTKFVVTLGASSGENVRSVAYRANQAGFMQGVVAGMLTESNKIGFVGGLEIPSLQEQLFGISEGAKSVNPDAEVLSVYTGSFIDVGKGKEAALSLISQGVDVLTAVADGGNVGTIQAAEENGAKYVGWPLDQRSLGPETVAVSILFDIPGYIEKTVASVVDGAFKGENVALGVAEGVLVYGPFSDWVPQEIQDKAKETQDGLASGDVVAPEYTP
jgi:basic membrane protein A